MPDNSPENQNSSVRTKENKKDNDGNEISFLGKCFAGFFLIVLTAIGALGVIAYWPDRLPAAGEKIAPLYINELFHIRLACVSDTTCCADCINNKNISDTAKSKAATDSIVIDSLNSPPGTDSLNKSNPQKEHNECKRKNKRLIHLNTLLLLLVAFGGFLGNMIHIATSFTTFVGAGEFKRSWLLWYCIKPFTASALAIGLYFVFRGGFLNMSDGGSSINLYGLMTISIFTGLFTDKATEKLKEVFEVLFKSNTVRPDPLTEKFKITGITPLTIEIGKANNMTLLGEKLDSGKFIISINDEIILTPVVTANSITFIYTIPATQKDKTVFRVLVKDQKGKEQFTADLKLKASPAPVHGNEEDDNAGASESATETAV